MHVHLNPASLRAALTLRGFRFLEGEGGEGGENDGNEFKSITSQEELDKVLGGRLARERDKFKDYDAYKEKAGKWDEYEASSKTPDEKALEEARTAATTETTQKFLQKLVRTEVRSIASTLGFNDPDDALRVIGDELPVKDDEPDTEALKKAIEKLAEEKPYLVTAPKKRTERFKPKGGEPVKDDTAKGGKGKATAALRQFGASRKAG